ncbi:PP2C family protein-serine/threonine phosphatase [Streptomyces sp. NPDC020490]|uniref:PP2C family protein-serine/threonine phosphatase n=1 Tax=Streptomyces sp. NPDC020490 TaxID=3365078 RepID=UPI0037AA19CA
MDTPRYAPTDPSGPCLAPDAAWGAAPCPVLVAGPRGDVLGLNPAAAALLPDAVRGAPLRDVVPAWIADAHERIVLPPTAAARGTARPQAEHGSLGDRTFAAHGSRTADGNVTWWLLEDTDRRQAEAALDSERERTAFLAGASSALLASLNLERCMEVTASLAAEHLAEAAVVVAPPRGRRFPVTHCRSGDRPVHRLVEARPAEVPGLGEALRGFPPVPSRWIDPAAIPGWVVPDGFPGDVGSAVVTPLPGHGVPAGALVLLRSREDRAFSESEEVFARLFAARAGAAMSAARMYAEQAAITSTLMRELLPPPLREVHGVEFAGSYRPSLESEHVGGDFYDVHPGADADQETLVVLGDVCGKGLEAAVLTGKIRNTVQALLPLAGDHQRLLDLLNGALINSHHTRFATLLLVSVARRGRNVHLRVTSAGHPPPLIVRDDGSVEKVDTRGTLVGVFPDITSVTAHVELSPGETCLLFTDGVTEARGGPLGDEMFGTERIEEALAHCAGMPAEAAVSHVRMLAEQWVGHGRYDDMALVAVTAPHHAHLSAVHGRTRGRYTA